VAAPDDYIGKTVAKKYRVEQMLGEGGMGRVYKATQLALDKPVVLKVLRQALLGDERTVARFQREAKAASRLNHPNSISVLDFGQADDGAMYIAMEYVQGKDLHHILSREWPLPEARVVRIMSQVLSALADAHSAGVIHRDLKPENIMVEQRRGEPDFVKVLDFGIAKIIDGTNDEGPALTRAGFVCGTPEYMSPEQARGAPLDHRSDLYAVGVILYQLMSGLLPFDSDSAVGFATKHLTEVPPPPSKRRPDAKISPAMERLILRTMAKSPDDRPQTAEQFRAELSAIDKERRASLSGGKVLSRSAGSNGQLRKVTPVDQQETRVSGPPVMEPSQVTKPRQLESESAAPSAIGRQADDGGASALVFKVATLILVLLAVGLAGAYAYQLFFASQQKETWRPEGHVLQELRVPAASRNSGAAERSAAQADQFFALGNLDSARILYIEAWRLADSPELALKLGEVSYQQGQVTEAAAWWRRYRSDLPDGKAIDYIDRLTTGVE
jgi:eukaryotic-like serine/threonine-protein kinase